MLLAIDIGNSNTVLGFYRNDKIIYSHRFVTKTKITTDELKAKFFNILNFCEIKKETVKAVLIASVVPNLNQVYNLLGTDYFNSEVFFVRDFNKNFPLKIKVDNVLEVGDDRLVNALAAYDRFKNNLIIIDFGTAITFDVVTKLDGYLGGLIFPGVNLALEYFPSATAKLPKIELEFPKQVTGSNTISAMQSGVTYGYLMMIEGIVEKICAEHNCAFKIIATGGMGEVFYSNSEIIEYYDADLTLDGLNKLYKKIK